MLLTVLGIAKIPNSYAVMVKFAQYYSKWVISQIVYT